MDEAAGRGTPEWLPDDPQLAAGYRALRRNAHPDTGAISTEAARVAVAEATKIEKAAAKGRVLKPLEEKDLLAPRYGTLYVRYPGE